MVRRRNGKRGKGMATKKEKTKEQRIKTEKTRLKGIFKDLDENKRKLVTPLIEKAAFMSIELQYASNATKLSVSTQLFDRALLNRNGVMDIWNMAHVEDGEKYYIRKEYTEVSELQNSNGKPQIIIQQAPIATGQQAEPQQTPPAAAGEPAGGLGEKEGVNNAD